VVGHQRLAAERTHVVVGADHVRRAQTDSLGFFKTAHSLVDLTQILARNSSCGHQVGSQSHLFVKESLTVRGRAERELLAGLERGFECGFSILKPAEAKQLLSEPLKLIAAWVDSAPCPWIL
jgi:hypothetical protein